MTARELLRATLSGHPVPRAACAPLAVHATARLAGVSLRSYTSDPAIMADCIASYHAQFKPDALWVSADTWITAEAMGARVIFPGDDEPATGDLPPPVASGADIDRIPPADPHARGRMPLMIEALRILRQRLGPDVFIVACFDQSPFSAACALAGITEVLGRTITDRSFIDLLMRRGIEHAVAYAVALAEAGADMLSTGDSPAGLLGPRLYREVALPAERQLFEAIRQRAGVPLSLHICGRVAPILADMATSGADVLEIDQQVDLAEACRVVPPEVAIWGNLDPVELLLRGSPRDVSRAARGAIATVRRAGRARFVLSSGCTLAPGTPAANLHALFEAARGGG